ncbi:alkaline phosphatase D family protein [Brevundimonas variabilis]|uniref:Alkaline phosphatase D n=1 Tax=Brevundimonas variabilis TaxID=74312 RepID=A0A7W9CKY6_9CAUL|nr:alkaline phosphatase D family protein [Brevundimonas variabilis]MBB5747504.1 alkaline phosphatase D [Brevundimonas variabilis]
MTIDRRSLLGWIGAGSAAATTTAAQTPSSAMPVSFQHGVASGDPNQTSAVFWTRVTPGGDGAADIEVELQVARDAAFSDIVRRTQGLRARAERDFTVKHDLDGQGLEPGTEYVYRFIAGGVTSPVGRVKTLPAGPTTDVVLAVASCQLHPGGLFNAYDAMAKLDRLDAVVHLGDYIYEYGASATDYGMATATRLNRIPQPPHEIVSLADYRLRHAQYKSDPDLQAAHARAPFICVWDDHEITNDAFITGAENHSSETEGDYSVRKATALKAYYEWMPIREPRAGLTLEHINRSFDFGDLASLHMVETRLLSRGEQLDYEKDLTVSTVEGQPRPDVAAFEVKRNDASRDLLGAGQLEWLKSALTASKASGKTWQILGNQVVMARVAGPDLAKAATPEQVAGFLGQLPDAYRPRVQAALQLFTLGVPFNLDAWDGYPAGRERLYAACAEAGVQPIVLAGDSHAFWVNELKDAAGARRGAEFGTSSISSPSIGDLFGPLPLGELLAQTNPEVVFCDQKAKGFIVLTITPDAVRGQLQSVSTILSKPYDLATVKTFAVTRGADGISAPTEV